MKSKSSTLLVCVKEIVPRNYYKSLQDSDYTANVNVVFDAETCLGDGSIYEQFCLPIDCHCLSTALTFIGSSAVRKGPQTF